MITIRVMWDRKSEEKTAWAIANELASLYRRKGYMVKLKHYRNRMNEGGRIYLRLSDKISISSKLSTVWDIVEAVRDKHMTDVEQFMSEGYSEHDCYEINSEVLRELKKNGFIARMDRLRDIKHYVVRVDVGGKYFLVDVVPELSGQFNSILESGFVGTDEEALSFYGIGGKSRVRNENRYF